MSELISIQVADISGDSATYTAFMRNESGSLLNTGGDAIAEVGTTGLFTYTLGEARVAGADYWIRIYSGTTEVKENLVYDDILYAGQTMVGRKFPAESITVIRGTVGPTAPSTTSFTPSAVYPSGSVANQWAGRIIVFDNNTTTVALRGQATDIVSSSADALPTLTFTALTDAPVSGDKFSIV